MASAKRFSWTMKTEEDGRVVVHNVANRAKGYGVSSYKTEEAARNGLKKEISFFSNATVIDWTITEDGVVIDRMAH